jgi:gluconokinase
LTQQGSELRRLGPFAVIVMGVSGSGKSTVGAALAAALGAPFFEGDAYHPAANVEKMAAGSPLDDDDRWPWLVALGVAMGEAAQSGGIALGACSALKRSYRDQLRRTLGVPLYFICLAADREDLDRRMSTRQGHFMPPSLLDSQLETLEPLQEDEWGVRLDSAVPVETVVAQGLAGLGRAQASGS